MVMFILGWLCGWTIIAVAMMLVWYAAKSEYNAGKAIEQQRTECKQQQIDFNKTCDYP